MGGFETVRLGRKRRGGEVWGELEAGERLVYEKSFHGNVGGERVIEGFGGLAVGKLGREWVSLMVGSVKSRRERKTKGFYF